MLAAKTDGIISHLRPDGAKAPNGEVGHPQSVGHKHRTEKLRGVTRRRTRIAAFACAISSREEETAMKSWPSVSVRLGRGRRHGGRLVGRIPEVLRPRVPIELDVEPVY